MRHLRTSIGATLAVLLLTAACATSAGDEPDSAAAPATSGAHGHEYQEPPPAAPLREGERFQELTMERAYSPRAPEGATDEYRCFMIDPALTEPAFLTGSQFLPQNHQLVHHAIFFRLEPDQVVDAEKLDAAEEGDGWRCFGNAGVGDAAWVAHWAPGADEVLLDQKVGYPMTPGSRLVMQIHYNLLATGGDAAASDRSSIRLRLSTDDLTPLRTGLLTAPVELPCAPGESGPLCDRAAAVADVTKRFGAEAGQTVEQLNKWCNDGNTPRQGPSQSCVQPVEEPMTVYAVAGHMHLLGRAISVELNPGTPQARKLLDIPAYDFDDQAIRPLDAPVQLKAGDTLKVSCTHDATLRQQLPALQDLPPRYVVWGEGTSDEMCLGILVAGAA
ncbi:monooxygenase [Catenuloplanes atrovinosus]|uniref:Copper type II ascorbate-dependent monooxygenase C-terminal domain-containing protein n=1 Tax=Catenuloplanes atrovinosus TaxID=137266 RepID=A0AAE3YV66_9ACTN|nr:monooxygenase [Catenuloplanes atrovinosus]MDR7279190.1 hypothetical protein [Catenuloplanes atrovinosus]